LELKNNKLKYMEIIRNPFKTFLLILGIIALVLITILWLLKKNESKKSLPPNLPTPTLLAPQSISQPTLEPTLILINQESTGVKEEILPEITQVLVDQKTTLRQNLPLIDKDFQIDFDYNEDKFMVTLNQPKSQSRATFELWLKKNYPAIPIDRFIIN